MNEDRIKLKTAILAKIKGVNLSWCDALYNPKIYTEYDSNQHIANPEEITFMSCSSDFVKEHSWYLAPTQSILQKWLRDSHQIYVIAGVDQTMEPKFAFTVIKYIKDFEWNPKILSEFLYLTYEEALEEGLQEGLKLI